MPERPYKAFTNAQLSNLFAEKLARPQGKYLEEPSPLWDIPAVKANSQAVETVFRIGPDGRPEAVTRLVDAPRVDSVRNAGESELAWLRRRVEEVLWRP